MHNNRIIAEREELDYDAEDVLPVMYDYHKRDIAEEFKIVESTDRVIVSKPEIGQSLYDVPGDSFELPADTDKSEYNTESYEVFEDFPDVSEKMAEDVAENGRIGIDASITDDDIVETAELTVEERAKQIATTIQKQYKSYDYLTAENKARLFDFRIDDNSYNLKLHAGVLKKLGIHMYGSDGFEDYQSIYEETMKRVEKPNSECERRYYNKEWGREKGR